MKKPTGFWRGCTAASALLFGLSVPAVGQQLVNGWKAYSDFSALRLVAVDESEGYTRFVFRNVSGRPISARVLEFDDEGGSRLMSADDAYSGRVLQNGGEFTEVLASREAAAFKARGVTVAAVVYEDGSSEGVKTLIDGIFATRLGWALENERLLGVLRDAVVTGQTDVQSVARRIGPHHRTPKDAVAAFPAERLRQHGAEEVLSGSDERLQMSFADGVAAVRQNVAEKVAQVRPASPREGVAVEDTRRQLLQEAAQELEDMSVRLNASLKRKGGRQ